MLRVPPFVALLRVQVCPLVIKLMSDRSLGTGAGGSGSSGSSSSGGAGASGVATPFPILLRTLRLMVVLVRQYHTLLAPDCEIFMSILLRQLEHESSLSHRVLALEAVKKFTAAPDLLFFFYRLLEESPDSSKVFGSMAHALSRVVLQAQSRLGLDEAALVHAMWGHASAASAAATANNGAGSSSISGSGSGSSLGSSISASLASTASSLMGLGGLGGGSGSSSGGGSMTAASVLSSVRYRWVRWPSIIITNKSDYFKSYCVFHYT
jgi:hypothetical protein